MASKIRKAVIPVAGMGTRGLPFTKEMPKEMLPIIDIPTIHFIVEEVLAAGIEQVIFVTSRGKHSIQDYFDFSPALDSFLRQRGKTDLADKIHRIGDLCEVMSVRQKEPLGLGHAVLCARHLVGNERFAVCLGDEIFPPWGEENQSEAPLKKLVEAASSVNASVVGTVEVGLSETKSYGMLKLAEPIREQHPVRVVGTVEKPAPDKTPSRFAIIGRYVFDPAIFEYLSQTPKGAGGEIQLTDGMNLLSEKSGLYALKIKAARYDVGNQFFYLKAQIDEALRRPELAPALKDYLKTL